MECVIHSPAFICVKMAWVAGLGIAANTLSCRPSWSAFRLARLEDRSTFLWRLLSVPPPLPSPVTLFWGGQVPPLLASVPRNPDGPRQIYRFPSCGFGFQPGRTETARDLAKNPAVTEDTSIV